MKHLRDPSAHTAPVTQPKRTRRGPHVAPPRLYPDVSTNRLYYFLHPFLSSQKAEVKEIIPILLSSYKVEKGEKMKSTVQYRGSSDSQGEHKMDNDLVSTSAPSPPPQHTGKVKDLTEERQLVTRAERGEFSLDIIKEVDRRL